METLNQRHEREMQIRRRERKHMVCCAVFFILVGIVLALCTFNIIQKAQCKSEYENSDLYSYTIQNGDTLNSITEKVREESNFDSFSHYVVRETIKDINDNIIVNSYLKAGDKIRLPR
jgi:cell division protein YceG involved in septum cleavage